MKIKENVTNKELKKILQKYKLICRSWEIDEETGHKTIYYLVREKTNEEKCQEVRELNPFDIKDKLN